MINIKVNSISHQFDEHITLESVLKRMDIATKGIAVAINLHVVARTAWKSQTFQDGDEILIIKATQGG